MNIELLRHFWMPDFHEVDVKTSSDFKAWISGGHYNVNQICNKNEIELYVNDPFTLTKSLAFDCSKFACASIESAQGIIKNTKFPKSLAWSIIRLYYSAFFAAHALIRVFGHSCSQLEKGHIKQINDYAVSIYGINTSLATDRGFYHGLYDHETKIYKLKKLKDTHSDTWSVFYKLLQRLSNDVLTVRGLTKAKQDMSLFLSELALSLTGMGRFNDGNWLSYFRNRVNYNLEYGAWFPYVKGAFNYDDISKYILSWDDNDLKSIFTIYESNEIKKFILVSTTVIRLCKLIIGDLEKACSGKSVHRNKFVAYNNLSSKP